MLMHGRIGHDGQVSVTTGIMIHPIQHMSPLSVWFFIAILGGIGFGEFSFGRYGSIAIH